MGTKDTRTIVFSQTTDAEFRTWVAAIIAQLAAIGLTQTADTGQINTGTVTAPVAANTAQGYTVWRFNDSLQSTTPIYFKLEFGSAAATTTPSMWITIGSGSNGSGTITGLIKSRTQRSFNAGTTNAINNRAFYDTTLGILWANWVNAVSVNGFIALGIMRGCDDDETPQAGVFVNWWTSSGGAPLLYETATLSNVAISLYDLTVTPGSDPVWLHEDQFFGCACAGYSQILGKMYLFPGALGVHSQSFATDDLLYATLKATERAYLFQNHAATPGAFNALAATNGKLALLWQ